MKPPREDEEGQGEDCDDPPSRLVSIGAYSFSECKNLHTIIGLEHAAESLRRIREDSFARCESLVNVDFFPSLRRLESLSTGAFYEDKRLTTVNLSRSVHLTELQDWTFYGCSGLKVVHLPPNTYRIGAVFQYCSALEVVHLPPRLKRIRQEAFKRCKNLKAIVLPPSVHSVGRNVFYDCGKLSCVVLPSQKIPFLKVGPFEACTSLSSLELPNPVPRQQWPLILEQFCREDGIARMDGGIEAPKNRNTIVFNFLRQHMPQFFVKERE